MKNLILVLLICSGWAASATLHDHYVDQILSSRSLTGLLSQKRFVHELRELRKTCRMQLETRQIPNFCFAVVERDRQWGLISAETEKNLLARFNDLCRLESRRALQNRQTLLSIQAPYLSEDCRTNLLKAHNIRAYRGEDGSSKNSWPDF